MTNKFANKTFEAGSTSTGNSGVDWKAYNEHISEAVQDALGCDEGTPASAIGIISGIIDYGKHQDPVRVEPMDEGDAKTKEWKQRQVDNSKATLENGMFTYQAPPRQEVGFMVDFYGATVDKGQFFGESNPAPYRVLLGGRFDNKPSSPAKVEGYPNDNNVWVFGDKSRPTSLAKAAKITDIKNGFAQGRLLELIGKAVSFTVEVYIDSKGYLKERITTPSPVMNGMPLPQVNEDLLFYVGMNEHDQDDYLKMLTKETKNYIKDALDYSTSKIKAQLEALDGTEEAPEEEDKQTPSQTVNPTQSASQGASHDELPIDFDQDIPF